VGEEALQDLAVAVVHVGSPSVMPESRMGRGLRP
jgi:hypothetical protein